MKNKAFTLIELLAVIIVLGLIAVITVPKINDELEKSKKNVSKASANSYTNAVEEYVMQQKMNKNNINLNGAYDINSDGVLYNKTNQYNIEFSGEKPKNGKLVYSNNDLQSGCITIGKYKVTFSNNKLATAEKGTCEYTKVEDMPALATTGDGLYEAQGEPGRYIYRGANPNNYITLKENNTDTTYRIVSYEPDGTIKVVRNASLTNKEWDENTTRKNSSNTYCNTSNGCNVWGNQTNTNYNGQTLTNLKQNFYYYYYPDNQSVTLSIKPNSNEGTVTEDSTLNTYLNTTWYNTLNFKDSIETHKFNVGGVYYYNTFNNGYSGGDKGLIKEKLEEQVYTWNGKVGLLNITEYVETSLSNTCSSVYSNFYYNPNNVTQDPNNNSSYTPKYSSGNWPCALQNWNYRSYFQWTLSSNGFSRSYVWSIASSGHSNAYSGAYNTYGVRPAFYLKGSVNLTGTGTSGDPYKLSN